MMNNYNWCWVACFFMLGTTTTMAYYDTYETPIDNIYSVLRQNVLLPNENYPIILQSDNAVDSIKFQLAIGSNTANSTLKNVLNSLTKEVTLAPNTRQLVNLAIPDLPVESYMFKLNVTIGNQKPIEKSSHLKFPKPSSMILIQTDKGLYKPGDKVLFRVVFLNKKKRPESGKNVGIHLIDPKSNRIKQWNQTLDQFGHFESEYTFSQNSELGQYQLHVQSGNNKRVLVIELAEYVLPLVEVKVQTPPYITYDSTQVPVTVEAHYTHGNAVQGTVNITLINKDYYETDEAKLWSEIMPLKEISVLKPINGKTETTFDPVKQLRLETVSYSTRLEVRAVVVETVSGRNYTASSEIQLSKEDVKFQLVSTTPNLKSGLDYYGRIKVTTQDDKPIDDPNNLVQIRYSFDSESKMQQLNATLSHGLIPLIIKVPLKAKYMYIGAMYKGQRYRLSTVSKTSGSNDTDIQFVPHNRTMEVDQIIEVKKDKVKIRVKTNVPISNYNYVISAEKRIVHHQQVKQASNNEFILDVPMLHSMNNGFKLIMYTLPTNNDSKKWSVEATTYEPITTDLTNLTLSSNVETARPGDMANIRVVGPPSAFVAVLGIDQSAMLLKEPNLINEAQFKREFGQLDQYEGAGSYYYEYKSYEEFESAFLTFTTNKFPPRPRMVYYSTRRLSGPAPEFQADTESMMISSPVYAKASAFGGSFRESAPTTRLRKDFPETWLWSSQVTDAVTGQTFFERPVPDTITSWVVNAFGVHPQSGLAVARAPLKLTVFNPFFIKPNLPYSIVREEVAAIPVIIYNYLGAHKKVDVTLYNELNEFVFTKTPSELFSSENELESEQEQSRLTKTVEVASGSVGKVIFMIRAQQVGHIKLQMLAQATDGSAGDKTEHLLLVKPEGQTQHFNKAFLVRNKRDSQNSSLRVDIAIPDDAVPGSRLITVNAIGDMLGVSFSNIEKLVRMPTGCGEQNMAGLVPNIVALEYLEATSQASPQLKQRILNHLEQGYARQLKYQHLDGGFSAFGSNNNNQSASTWLTAYVVAWFVPAMRSIDIDKNVVQKSVDFLVGRKVENGKSGVFQELGRLYDRHMSGGVAEHLESSNSTALDAFVLIALNRAASANFIERGQLNYTIKQIEAYVDAFKPADVNDKSRDNDFYTLAIVAHALKDVGSDRARKAMDLLWSLRQTKDQDKIFFAKPKRDTKKAASDRHLLYYSYLNQADSNSVEATGYALNVLNSFDETENALATVKWLVSKQNQLGGWSSTQDTVVALTALAKFAAKVYDPNTDLKIRYESQDEQKTSVLKGSFDVTKDNLLVLQKAELSERGFEAQMRSLKSVQLTAVGVGSSVAQVSWQYNVVKEDENKQFNVTTKVTQVGESTSYNLNVCARLATNGETNMAIVQIMTPSGFEFDSESIDELRRSIGSIRRIDIDKSNTDASFYFDKLTNEPTCFDITVDQINVVVQLKPAFVYVYDYYETSKATRHFYTIKQNMIQL